MAAIEDAIRQVQAALELDATLAALSRPDDPTDNLNLPAQVVHLASGGLEIANMDGDWDGLYTIAVETHVPRKNLAAGYAALYRYLPLINRQLTEGWNANHFGGTVMLVGGGRTRGGALPIRFDIAQDSWADTDTLAMVHEFDVRLSED